MGYVGRCGAPGRRKGTADLAGREKQKGNNEPSYNPTGPALGQQFTRSASGLLARSSFGLNLGMIWLLVVDEQSKAIDDQEQQENRGC